MTREYFFSLISKLDALRFAPTDERILEIYFERLNNLQADVFKEAIEYILDNQNEFPTIAQIRGKYFEIRERRYRFCERCNKYCPKYTHECFIYEDLLMLKRYSPFEFKEKISNPVYKQIYQKFGGNNGHN
jgi:hypothetical protein